MCIVNPLMSCACMQNSLAHIAPDMRLPFRMQSRRNTFDRRPTFYIHSPARTTPHIVVMRVCLHTTTHTLECTAANNLFVFRAKFQPLSLLGYQRKKKTRLSCEFIMRVLSYISAWTAAKPAPHYVRLMILAQRRCACIEGFK